MGSSLFHQIHPAVVAPTLVASGVLAVSSLLLCQEVKDTNTKYFTLTYYTAFTTLILLGIALMLYVMEHNSQQQYQ
jgi:hypothetical protein